MKTNELRKKYLEFFKSKNHTVFSSDTLVPDDESVLFTSAGMNRFKPYFLGEKKDLRCAVSSQKCLRTGDLSEVGKTPYHHTFFEMLGNFSFGDYFKKEAIEYAWEFVTGVLGIAARDIWVSVYKDDDEAFAIWVNHIGISNEVIVRLDEDKNFWPASAPTLGPNGPCGPCSEIFFDRGAARGCGKPSCSPSCDCGRFVEIWNLVFTQFNRVGVGKLLPLPQKNIDTGMGLERIAAVMQGKYSNFEIDILAPVVSFVKKILRITAEEPRISSLVNAIVDHARAVSFSIADGVYPSNEERGYVIRKLIRQASFKGSMVGQADPFLHKLVPLYAQLMEEPYPEINEKKNAIAKIIFTEEERFLSTLKEGRQHFDSIATEARHGGNNTISAEALFKLYDTYGFPVELSRELAKENNITVDETGFEDFLAQQRQQSRKKSMFDAHIFKQGELSLQEHSIFVGYEDIQISAQVLRIFTAKGETGALIEGDSGLLVLDKTPFYPESGGQLQDKGWIKTDRAEFAVEEVFRVNEAIVHKGKLIQGSLAQETVTAALDRNRRQALARAHTATHLLQAALRSVLGDHVMQQGSLVDEDRLRFDFTNPKALTVEELTNIEDAVNAYIMASDPIIKRTLTLAQAKQEGALAFFKDKYKDTVRVVSVAGYSKELCGGIHLDTTSQVGSLVIIAESSIASGTRRIEALTGKEAYRYTKNIRTRSRQAAGMLKCADGDISSGLQRLIRELRQEQDKTLALEKAMIAAQSKELVATKKDFAGTSVITKEFSAKDSSLLLYLCDMLRNQVPSVFVFLVSR
ncbi:MAG: alanine--tRNA ligase, partial [Candidatus Omnitrophica bacterium]|nr:alanine--tRNA ligase [Candidatus Omnitrophota bacterium]